MSAARLGRGLEEEGGAAPLTSEEAAPRAKSRGDKDDWDEENREVRCAVLCMLRWAMLWVWEGAVVVVRVRVGGCGGLGVGGSWWGREGGTRTTRE